MANAQRDSFKKNMLAAPKESGGPEKPAGNEPVHGVGNETKIMHNGDGSHTVHHADGAQTEHPHLHHAMMEIHGRHHPGEEAGAVHKHEGGATSHHVGMDGMVNGPSEHGSGDEAADHVKEMIGENGGNGAMESAGMHQPDTHGELNYY